MKQCQRMNIRKSKFKINQYNQKRGRACLMRTLFYFFSPIYFFQNVALISAITKLRHTFFLQKFRFWGMNEGRLLLLEIEIIFFVLKTRKGWVKWA